VTTGLEVSNVSKRFGHVEVLRDVSLIASPGKITTLLGPNGAGKSTLFKIVLGLVRPDGGDVRVGGVPALGVPLHEKAALGLGYLPQESASFPELTAEENLRGVLELAPLSAVERRARLAELFELTGLAPVAARPYSVLSTGERRRLEIAKALAGQPRVLLLDEPFSGLDPRVIEGLREVLRRLAERSVAVLLTDHNVHMTFALADEAYLLVGGRIICNGPPARISADPLARESYLGQGFVAHS
jgi:lipopolysaccharide export system ATP-binding protein